MNLQQDASVPARGELPPDHRFASVGARLANAINEVLRAIPGKPAGPMELARAIGVDKVLASRTLKAARHADPMAALYVAPGPDPLRRLMRAAQKAGVPKLLVRQADEAVEAFELLIRREAGDRSALNAILSGWLPEARAEFELRCKQAAFRAISQLRGVATHVNVATVFLHPSDNGTHLDVVWIFGVLGVQRLRPVGTVKFSSRRFAAGQPPRVPRTLDGEAVEGLAGLRLDAFCSQPPPALNVQRVGDVVHYTLAESGVGPRSACDLMFAEVNLAEMLRELPAASARRRHVFAEVSIPCKVLLFDALLHRDVFPDQSPGLLLYDTAFEGVADVNDPRRDIDRLDLRESIEQLGTGVNTFRTADVPRYVELLRLVCDKLGWRGDEFRGYRCRIDYPMYGAQVVMTWDGRSASIE